MNVLNINFCLTYKVHTSTQPTYYHNLISLQPRNTCSCLVILSRPPTISSFKITSSLESTSRFILSASSVLSQNSSSCTSQVFFMVTTLSIHHSLTLSVQAQNLPFQQILPIVDFFYLLDCLTITGLDRTYHAHHFIFSFTF